MAGLFRAYGQLRRGSAPWRTPFLIPIGDLVPPFIQGSSNVSIDTGGAQPDLRLALVPISIDHWPSLQVQLRVQPIPGRVLHDITLRMVLLMKGDSPFLDDGPLETDAGFVALDYRISPTRTFPQEIRIDLSSNPGGALDSNDTSVSPAPLTPPFPVGKITVDGVGIHIAADPLEIAGGLVNGPMVHLAGVETDYNSITNSGYHETARQIRGIPLEWAEPTPPTGAVMPASATWIDAVATLPPPPPPPAHAPPSEMSIHIDMPTVGDGPDSAPAVSARAGGGLRPGSYRYCTTFVHHNGNESSTSDRSDPVTVDATSRTVRVTGFPTPAPPPSPDPTGLAVTGLRLYRTDPDTTADLTDPDLGSRGDDVLVSAVALGTTSFDDAGPADPTVAPTVRRDYLSIRYSSPQRLGISGTIRMIGTGSDETYGGAVTSAPLALRAIYRPGGEPNLLWVADSATPSLSVDMGGFSSPFGTGLHATVSDVPTRFALDWLSLGSEYFGLAAAGDLTAGPASGTDPSVPIGRIGIRFGPTAPPANWPAGEADVAAELSDASSGTAGGLIALTGLRRGSVDSGGRVWSTRDADLGLLALHVLFQTALRNYDDRTLRFARHSGGTDKLPELAVTGHFVPDVVDVTARLGDGVDPMLALAARVRFIRAAFTAAPTSGSITGRVFLDDTTDKLTASMDTDATLATAWPVRAGGTVQIRPGAGAPPDTTVWPDVVVPASAEVSTGWPTAPISAKLSDAGLSGRVAMAQGADPPVAVRSNPQAKVMLHGGAETTTGLRAATVRFLGAGSAMVPTELLSLSDKTIPQIDVSPVIGFQGRANQSFRAELLERESRVASDPDLRAPVGARSWLRARTTLLPDGLTPTVRLAFGQLVGGVLASSALWGDGVVWAEPSFVWDTHTDELGLDKGIGLITAGWDQIPTRFEAWLLDKGAALDGQVEVADRLPTVGPVGPDWVPGGAVLRVNDDLRLSHVQIALPQDARVVCWNDDSSGGFGTGLILQPDRAAHHGEWMEVIAPFIKLEPTSAATNLRDLVVWSVSEPVTPTDPNAPEPNPCGSPPAGPDPATALGWRIHDELAVTMAVRIYGLATPTGVVSPPPRWWSMATTTEKWNGDEVHTGEWELNYDVQMKDYGMAQVAVYPKSSTSNPFGDWQGGNGTWWLRERGGLKIPLFILFGPDIASGDVFLGNVGGGFHVPGTNGIFSTLPQIFAWSYP